MAVFDCGIYTESTKATMSDGLFADLQNNSTLATWWELPMKEIICEIQFCLESESIGNKKKLASHDSHDGD